MTRMVEVRIYCDREIKFGTPSRLISGGMCVTNDGHNAEETYPR